MSPLRDVLEQLLERRNLGEAQAEDLLTRLTNPEESPAMAGALLAALRSKGVVAEELRGFARAMRKLARRPNIPEDFRAIDIVGTGGDSSGSLNMPSSLMIVTFNPRLWRKLPMFCRTSTRVASESVRSSMWAFCFCVTSSCFCIATSCFCVSSFCFCVAS